MYQLWQLALETTIYVISNNVLLGNFQKVDQIETKSDSGYAFTGVASLAIPTFKS